MNALRAAVLLALLALPARAVTDFSRGAVGSTGSEFLNFDTSARGIALGGAMTAAVNDASALYWNPAGLAQIPRFSATFLHARWIEDVSYSAGAAAVRVNDSSVLGGGVRFLDAGSITRTDINGNVGGSFHPRSYVAEVGWGQSVYDLSDSEMDVAVGAAGKVLHSDLGETANAFAGDLGLQARFYTAANSYDAGFALQNVGRGQKFDQVRDSMPARIRFGGGLRPVKPLLLVAEGFLPINNRPHAAVGVEWTLDAAPGVRAALRGGLNSLTAESLGLVSTLSAGFGISVSDLSFDYALVPTGVLGGSTHRFSVSYNLPAKVSRRYRER